MKLNAMSLNFLKSINQLKKCPMQKLILENIPLLLSLPLSLYDVHQPLHPYSYLTPQLFYYLIDKEKSCFCFFKIYDNSPALPLRLLPRPKLLHQILFLLFVPLWLNLFSLPFFFLYRSSLLISTRVRWIWIPTNSALLEYSLPRVKLGL